MKARITSKDDSKNSSFVPTQQEQKNFLHQNKLYNSKISSKMKETDFSQNKAKQHFRRKV